MAKEEQKEALLGAFEELVLVAVLRHGEDAYGVPIWEEVQNLRGRETSMGAVYTTLERLKKKGFLKTREGEPLPERGGRGRRYYALEGAGLVALEEAMRIHDQSRPAVLAALGARGVSHG